MSEPVIIRPVDSVDELVAVFDLLGAHIVPSFDHTDRRRFDDVRAAYPAQRDILLVAEADGAPVGGALGFTTDTVDVTLRAFALAPDYRRRGLGRALLHAFERGARQLGAERISLGAAEATGFYLRCGYQISAGHTLTRRLRT